LPIAELLGVGMVERGTPGRVEEEEEEDDHRF
jgi:hypothetical protein